MPVAAILNYEPHKLAPQSREGNHQGNGKGGDQSAPVEHKRSRSGMPQSTSKKGHQGKSHDLYPPAENSKDLSVDEIIDELGPLSSEEKDKILEWLKLGS